MVIAFQISRFRYQLGLDIPIWKNEKQQTIIVKIKDEIMFNAGNKIVKNTFDQNRIYLAVNYKLNNSYAVELGYMTSGRTQNFCSLVSARLQKRRWRLFRRL